MASKELRHYLWVCTCDCGTTKIVRGDNLLSGNSKSCGCEKNKIKHGFHGKPVYWVWAQMLQRCSNPSNGAYTYYGKRGINVCKKWRNFYPFLKDMGEPQKFQTLERIDNNRGYNKENCKWASRQVQANNRRSNHCISYKGKKQTIAQWSKELCIPYPTLVNRLKRWKTVKEAFERPVLS